MKTFIYSNGFEKKVVTLAELQETHFWPNEQGEHKKFTCNSIPLDVITLADFCMNSRPGDEWRHNNERLTNVSDVSDASDASDGSDASPKKKISYFDSTGCYRPGNGHHTGLYVHYTDGTQERLLSVECCQDTDELIRYTSPKRTLVYSSTPSGSIDITNRIYGKVEG